MPSAYQKSGFRPPSLVNPAPARIALNAPFQLPGGTEQKTSHQGFAPVAGFCLDWSFLIPSPYRGGIIQKPLGGGEKSLRGGRNAQLGGRFWEKGGEIVFEGSRMQILFNNRVFSDE